MMEKQLSRSCDITKAIECLKRQDVDAAELIWDRFFSRLCQYSKTRISHRDQRLIDYESLAASALFVLIDGMQNGSFQDVDNREQLWNVLMTVASRKAIDLRLHYSRQKRGDGNVRGDSVFSKIKTYSDGRTDFIKSDPAELFFAKSMLDTLLAKLPDDKCRQIAMMRLSSHSDQEIADQIDCTIRTVQRKLSLIREVLKFIHEE